MSVKREVVVAVTYNPSIDRFLLVKRSGSRKRFPSKWEFPSGFIENETEQQASLRELEEETGLIGEVIKTGEPFDVPTSKYNFKIHPVLVKVDGKEIELTKEHEDYRWVKKSDIESFDTVPQLEKDMEKLGII